MIELIVIGVAVGVAIVCVGIFVFLLAISAVDRLI